MPKKRNQKSISLAKRKAWEAFSLYIRTRDSLLTTGNTEGCACISCGRWYSRTGTGCIQAGHFLGGRAGAVLFSEDGVHGQCYGCNIGRAGNHAKYTLWMIDNYGRERVDELIVESKRTVKRKLWDYQELEEKYKLKTQALLEEGFSGIPQPKRT